MLIPLTDPIWSRLYGPYGVKDVAGDLGQLTVRWDKAVAANLFWERLHHQETLYPVTYAALPWLREIALGQEAARRDVLIFLSWIVYCATAQEVGQTERFVGLFTDPARHHVSWLPREQWLTEADMGVLKMLGDWMEASTSQIARDCLAEMNGETDRATVSHLAWAPLCHWGSRRAARVLEMVAEGEEVGFIRDAVKLVDADFVALQRLAVEAPSQAWVRDLAFELDGRERRSEQGELPLM